MERMKGPVDAEPQQEEECGDHDRPNNRVGGQHRSHDRTERMPSLAHKPPEQSKCEPTLASRSWVRLFGSRSFAPQRHRFTIPEKYRKDALLASFG